MTWRQPTAHYHEKKKQNSSGLMDSLRRHVSFRMYIPLLATLLSKLSRNSERLASVAKTNFPYPAQAFAHAVEWRSVAIHPLNAHQSQFLSSAPIGVQSDSGLLQNAFHKTSSVCSWFGNPNVLFPSWYSCHFHQLESS